MSYEVLKNKLQSIFYLYGNYVLTIVVLSVFIIFLYSIEEVEVIDIKEDVKFQLVGQDVVTLPLYTTYNDEGFSLSVNGNVIDNESLQYIIEGKVLSDVAGEYILNYIVYYGDDIYSAKRSVRIVDNVSPVIKILNDNVEIFKCKKKDSNNLQFIAYDNYDGILTDLVKVKKENGNYVLSVSDSSGNFSSIEVPYINVKKVSPSILLNGTLITYVEKGSKYIDEGVYLTDGCGKKIKGNIKVINNVDTSLTGTFIVKYEYLNGDNVVTNERQVVVYEEVPRIVNERSEKERIVYLTFDDGPGRYTERILEILDKYNAKATFFVTNQFKSYVPLIKNIDAAGHTVAVHTLTHKWSVYQSLENYLKDFNDMDAIVYKYTGKHSEIFRFPGGASNAISKQQSKGVVSAISSYMSSKGYISFDWNVDSLDASGASKEEVVKNVIAGINAKKVSVVLMHDIKKATFEGLEDILKYGIDNGYQFLALDKETQTIHHGIRN